MLFLSSNTGTKESNNWDRFYTMQALGITHAEYALYFTEVITTSDIWESYAFVIQWNLFRHFNLYDIMIDY